MLMGGWLLGRELWGDGEGWRILCFMHLIYGGEKN